MATSLLPFNRSQSFLVLLACSALTTPSLAQNGLPHTIEAPPGSVAFGGAVISGGDADHDGFDDVLVADLKYERGPIAPGRWIMYSGRTGAELWSAIGAQPLASFPIYVAGSFIGDLDGDQCDDIILGQPSADGGRGRVDVYSGRTGAVLRSYTGASADDGLGRDAFTVGDVNGDTTPDFAFVSRFAAPGFVSVRSGRNGSELFQINRDWPRCIRPLGDINRDDRDDIGIGSWELTRDGMGIGIYSGRDGQRLAEIGRPDFQDDMFGWQLAGGVDLTGDQTPDIIASGRADGASYAYLIDGRTGQATRQYEVPNGPLYNELFGVSVRLADVNADGRVEAIFESFLAMYVFDGPTGQLLHFSQPHFDLDNAWQGTEVALGDVNGDGAADFITADQTPPGRIIARAGAPILLHPFRPNWRINQGVEQYTIKAYSRVPDRRIHFLASRRGTSCTFVPQIQHCIDLRQPFLQIGTAITDADGFATLTINPSHVNSGPVWLQALEPRDPGRGAITSNVLELQITE